MSLKKIAFLLILAGGVAGYLYYNEHRRRIDTLVNTVQQAVQSTAEQEESSLSSASEGQGDLPLLENSDPSMQEELLSLFGSGPYQQFFIPKDIIRHIVVTVDNMPARQLPIDYLPVKPVPGALGVTTQGGKKFLNAANYLRYLPYIRLLDQVDAKKLVAVYTHFYPLFESAYRELGNQGHFQDRLLQAIDSTLSTPEVRDPIYLVQPIIYYKYADPDLENMYSAAQKIMVRIGPDNAKHVKTKLQQIRDLLTKMPQKNGP